MSLWLDALFTNTEGAIVQKHVWAQPLPQHCIKDLQGPLWPETNLATGANACALHDHVLAQPLLLHHSAELQGPRSLWPDAILTSADQKPPSRRAATADRVDRSTKTRNPPKSLK